MKRKSYRLLSLLLAALLVIGLLPAMAFAALADGEAYDGDEVTLLYIDKSGKEADFGMLRRQEGSTCRIEGDKVVIHYVPNPKGVDVYGGLHWGTADDTITADSIDVAIKDGVLDITLDKSACGKMHQAVAVKVTVATGEDGKETTTYAASSQLYLAIPSEDKIASSQTDDPGTDPSTDPSTNPDEPIVTPAEITNLSVYDEERMFRVVNAFLETADGKTTLKFALNSTGYEDIFAGTYEEAIANGKNKANWIHYKSAMVDVAYEMPGEKVSEDKPQEKYQFAVPVTLNVSGETKIPIVSIAKSKAAAAEKANPDAPDYSEAFFGRQFVVDVDKKTLVTGNFRETSKVDVTSNVIHFQLDSKYDASLSTVGSPSANEFKSYLTIKMGDDTYTKVYLGSVADAKKNASKAEAIKDGVIELKFANTLGADPMIKDGKAVAAFYVADDAAFDEAGKWVERTFVFDYEKKTVTVEGKSLHATRKIEYDGKDVTFVKADLKSGFGMWAPQDGSTFSLKGDKLIVHIKPKNVKTYGSMHFGPIDDATLSKDYTLNSDGTIDLELDADEYCGYATAIAPIKKSDGGTTAAQYYLTAPAVAEHDKSVTLAGIRTADGTAVDSTEDLIFKFDALTAKEAVSLNPNVSSEKDIVILWQKDVQVAEGTQMPVTLSFEVSGLEVEQEIYVYHYVDGAWTYVTAGKQGKVEAEFESFSPIALAVSAPQAPQTGDSSNILLWTMLAVLAAGCAVLVVVRRRREEY